MPTTVQIQPAAARTLEELQKSQRSANQKLGKDAFMKLLVAQMASQDPLNPTSDTDFIAQLAQFSMLEQLQSLGESSLQTQAYSLLGKYVYVSDTDKGGINPELIFGKVEGVFKQNGIDYVVVDEKKYPLSNVVGLAHVDEAGNDASLAMNAQLIGKTVKFSQKDEFGDINTLSGILTKLFIKDGTPFANAGEHEFPLSEIIEIS